MGGQAEVVFIYTGSQVPELLRETPYWLPLGLPVTGCRFKRQYSDQFWNRASVGVLLSWLKPNPSHLLASGSEEGLYSKGCLQWHQLDAF